MNLKEELAKLEEEEQLTEVEDRLNGIQEIIYGLYRRIGVIVEYIDNQEVTTITEEQLKQDEQHFREEGIRKAWELKALELAQKNKDLTKLLKEQENKKENSYQKGYEDGVSDLASLISKTQVQSEKDATKDKIGRGLERAVGDV